MSSTDIDPTAQYRKRFEELRSIVQKDWAGHWNELAEYFAPRKSRYLTSMGTADDNSGKKKNSKIINSIPVLSVNNLTSGLFGNMTSATSKWFRLALRDQELMNDPSVSRYLYEVAEIMLEVFGKSNFYGAMHSNYNELAVFGTAAMMIEEDFKDVIRCRPFTAGEYFLALSPQLEPDTLYRQYSMSVRQVVDEYGIENVSTPVKNMYDNNQGEKLIKIVACIQPMIKNDPAVKMNEDFQYESVHYEQDHNEGKFLRRGGYLEKPFMAPRWDATSTDVYGRSPAMDALGDAKMLQKEEEKKLKVLDKFIDPPLQAPSSMKNEVISQVPGGVTYMDATEPGAQGIRTLYEQSSGLPAAIAAAGNDIAIVEQRIQRTFFNDLFQTVINESKRMTATEVAQRREEKLSLLGPVVNRLQSEVLGNAIERTFAICERLGMFPDVPEIMEGRPLEIQYISALAQAQSVVTTQSVEQVFAFAGNLSAVYPEVLDRLDADEAIESYAESYGVPPMLVRSDEEVEEIRAQRAQAQQAMQQQEAMAQSAQSAKVLSETEVGGNNALAAIMGDVG
jgi:hypothetical protein